MDLHYEPFSPEVRDDPYPIYAALRSHAPVYRAEQAEAWVLSRYDDVLHVLKHPELFSSEAMGTALPGRPPSAPSMLAGGPRVVILLDPPHHAPLRNLLNRGFTPRRVSALERRLREIVNDAMARLRRPGSVDLVSELAVPVPVTVIAELLGVEPSRMHDFKRWSDEIIAGVTGSARRVFDASEPSFGPSMQALRSYLGELVEQRRRAPTDDLLSVLVRAEAGEAALEHDEVVLFAVVLLIAGNETTTNLIGNFVRSVLARPEQLAKLVADRSLLPNAIEETLRYEAPIQFLYRRARRDLSMHGVRIPEGDFVIGLIGSANRDERRFEAADVYDIERDASGHLSFGFGIHFCLGASLARLEARCVLEALLDELPRLKQRDAEIENVDSFLMRGPRELVLERAA